MAELKSHEVLSQLRFKTYRWNLYDTVNLKTQTREIKRTLDEDGYRTKSSFTGEVGYIYTYYISHSIPFTVDISLLNSGSSIIEKTIKYKQNNSIYEAEISATILDKNIKNNWIVFDVQWQESQPKLPSTNLICLTGIFQTDYYQYYLIHPYHYNPQDYLLANIILFTTDNALESSHNFTLDKDGFIKDPVTRDAFLYNIYPSKDEDGNGVLKINFSKDENFFNFIEIVYIT